MAIHAIHPESGGSNRANHAEREALPYFRVGTLGVKAIPPPNCLVSASSACFAVSTDISRFMNVSIAPQCSSLHSLSNHPEVVDERARSLLGAISPSEAERRRLIARAARTQQGGWGTGPSRSGNLGSHRSPSTMRGRLSASIRQDHDQELTPPLQCVPRSCRRSGL